MNLDTAAVRHCLKSFDFKTLFREHLGWDHHQARLDLTMGGVAHALTAVAQKRGFVAFVCPAIPDRATRLKIDQQITKSAREHLVIYADPSAGQQVWQWVRREPGQPLASRDHRFDASQSGAALIQRLERIAVSLDEEEQITVVDVAGRARAAFDVDQVTRKFYDRFKTEHAAFLQLIAGIQADADLQWYTSLMLNRLMFAYFIQKKGFLDGDADYLRNRLARVREVRGRDQFQSFYRYFLLRLFHDGLGKAPAERRLDPVLERLLGQVPYLDGGFFEVHPLEEQNPGIDIPDQAFERLFDFFDRYSWHLDERPLRADNEINPDVVGYIFEKYINQKQMGAYYTKEDITEYIAKNTIIPFLFDAAAKQCPIAFEPDGALWWLLRDDPDRYLYPAVRHGVIGDDGSIVPAAALPDFVRQGMGDPNARMADKRYNLQQAAAGDPLRLVTETWREYVCRRQRALAIREQLRQGEVHKIDDFITLNLDLWQFARDAIVNAEGPELLRGFWRAIEKVTVLDPTCGSGAFLFAALRILETLYGDCLERMKRFVEDKRMKDGKPVSSSSFILHPASFEQVLERIAKHPNERYFILKSIIINNLFGVDLMEEAVEICKLRLFLKLVAQVETVGQIEPLPDIDFNIRAGNTLVGYVTLDQVRKSQEGKFGFWEDDIQRIEEDAELVERAFRQFRAQQTRHGGKVTAEDKQELRRRLTQLGAQLDRYLAGEYGVKVEMPKDFDAWRVSHEPFHWFIEFYGIIRAGGFDVIVGNPPYVEYSKVKKDYTIRGYKTENSGNLYALCTERSLTLLRREARFGFIVQQPITSTLRMADCRQVLVQKTTDLWVSTFDDRPSKLFDGMHHARLAIILARVNDVEIPAPQIFVTSYNKWSKDERIFLFAKLQFINIESKILDGVFPKFGTELEAELVGKVLVGRKPLEIYLAQSLTPHCLFYKITGVGNWFTITTRPPKFLRGKSVSSSTREATIPFTTTQLRDIAFCLLNSSLFYWFYQVRTNCRDFNPSDFKTFPIPNTLANDGLDSLANQLSNRLDESSMMVSASYQKTGNVSYEQFRPRAAKDLIDRIDAVLAQHYGFTDEELDFIINYDIKYRMGKDTEEEGN